MSRQNKRPLADLLKSYVGSDRISFHVPGHKGETEMQGGKRLAGLFPQNVLKADITEIDGFDDLHCPEGVIAEAQQLAAELFGAEETFFLVNGTTSGIMAAVAAAAWEEAPVLIARDCHKSVIRGLIFSGAMPVYIQNDFDISLEIPCGIRTETVRDALEKNPGVRALILSNPSYYGTYSQLREIVELCHREGVQVIADEAHGAQLYFAPSQEICGALEAGCDVSVQSTHKMLGSLTQSSMLHVQGDLVDRSRLRALVSMMNTTSPSYLLMSSLDAVRRDMAQCGRAVWENVFSLTRQAAEEISAIPGMHCVTRFSGSDGRTHETEGARLLITAGEAGIGGRELVDILARRYHIDMEFADHRYVIAVSGSGTTAEHFLRLKEALADIARTRGVQKKAPAVLKIDEMSSDALCSSTEAFCRLKRRSVMTPRKAFYSSHETVPLADACGKASASDVAVYPPGIPVLCPGEEITEEICSYLLEECRKESHIHGIVKGEDGQPLIRVVTGEVESMLFHMFF